MAPGENGKQEGKGTEINMSGSTVRETVRNGNQTATVQSREVIEKVNAQSHRMHCHLHII